jgi:protocatechuate 3,4-dioxygenase, beta subunit
MFDRYLTRRFFLSSMALGAAAYAAPGAFAEELMRTPSQTEGPFYPDKLPLDTDNDLLIVNDSITAAVGEVTHLSGRVLDLKGTPMKNVTVEIWQCDAKGAYLHTRTGNREKRDANFQGFGRFTTGLNGTYCFRTIKPVAYPGRTPHIHFKLKKAGKEMLTTQCYIKGEAKNVRGMRDAKARESVLVAFTPIKESRIGELAATFDIILGVTPEDNR